MFGSMGGLSSADIGAFSGLASALSGGAGVAPGGATSGFGAMPTAAGEVKRGKIPRYFTEQPQGQMPLSPLAQAYLAQMFPQFLWGEETSPYTITPYKAAEPAVSGTGPTTHLAGFPQPSWPMPDLKSAVPAQTEVMGETEKVTPKAPSAQLYKHLQAQGATPSLRQYVEDILEIPWESYVGTIQAYWPTAEKRRSPTWRTTRQL